MGKQNITETLKLEHCLEKDIQALRKTLIKPLSAEPHTNSATRANEACEAVKTATEDLRKLLRNMFFKADSSNSDSGGQM